MDKTSIQQNLEQTLNLIGSIEKNEVYSKINDLIGQAGYKEVKQKKRWNEYFVKQNDDGENLVFIRFAMYERHYGFAKVKPDKLEEFCERLNWNDKREINPPETSSFIIGAGTGSVLSLLGKQVYYNIKGIESLDPSMDPIVDTMIIGFFGMCCGAFLISHAYNALKKRRNIKKWDECYSLLKLDEEALKLAFGETK